jgi:GxxExxY protein
LDLNLNAVTQQIIGVSIRVHIEIGVGLLEYVCEKLLSDELAKQGLPTRTQVPIPVVYNYHKFNEIGFRADLIVNNEVLIEVKSTEGIAPIHCK